MFQANTLKSVAAPRFEGLGLAQMFPRVAALILGIFNKFQVKKGIFVGQTVNKVFFLFFKTRVDGDCSQQVIREKKPLATS